MSFFSSFLGICFSCMSEEIATEIAVLKWGDPADLFAQGIWKRPRGAST
jgi:hypothetical protein